MHISDGVLSAPVWIGGYAASAAIITATAGKIDARDIPKTAIMTSLFFVASLVYIPIGPTSVHLILSGLAGVILGPLAFVSIFLGLVLQALLFQHGGITTIGVNSITMGIPALAAYKIFGLRDKIRLKPGAVIFGVFAGGFSVFAGTCILALFLASAGDEFIPVAKLALVAHIPVIIIEAIITGFIVSFIMRVKPELLERRK